MVPPSDSCMARREARLSRRLADPPPSDWQCCQLFINNIALILMITFSEHFVASLFPPKGRIRKGGEEGH